MNDSLWGNIKSFLNEKLYITITPSTRNKIKNYSFHRFIPIVIAMITIVIMLFLAGNYLIYRNKYMQVTSDFNEYKESINLDQLQEENKTLKKNLLLLSQNTEELRSSIENIRESNQEIRGILGEEINEDGDYENKNISLTSVLDYNSNILNQGIPMGGSQLNLYYYETDTLINRMYQNVNVVSEEIVNQNNIQSNLKNKAIEYKDLHDSIPDIWPLADNGESYISSNFGWRNDPITSRQEYHEGLDIAVWYNTPVIATSSGKVTYSGWNGGYGWCVEVDHGHGYKTYYAHLNKIKVSKGEKVKKRQILGLSGNSGKSTGPHLHYEIRINGVPKNPRNYIGR